MKYAVIYNNDQPLIFDNVYQLIKFIDKIDYDEYIQLARILRGDHEVTRCHYNPIIDRNAFMHYTIKNERLKTAVAEFRELFVEHNKKMRILNSV